MKFIVAIAFIAILGSLASALFFMMKGGDASKEARQGRMAKALAFRIGFSVVLFICILASWKLGWLQPTGIQPGK